MSELAISQQTSSPTFFIKITQGPNNGDVYRISPPGVIVGRDPSATQITLNDERVSRQQCRIDFLEDIITVEDLSGKSSTFVNNQPITKHSLNHGDVISLGDSILVFEVGGAPPKLGVVPPKKAEHPSQRSGPPGYNPSFSAPVPARNNKRIRFIMIVVVLGAALGYLALMPEPKAPAPAKVNGPDEINLAIEEVQRRQVELAQPNINLTEQDLYNKRSAEKHFIRGFRDYQNGKYTRAIEAFQTTLATDPHHGKARRYASLAEKKRSDMVDYHMDLGRKYRDKGMYKMCMAEFEKVLQIMNQPAHKKYQLAKEQIKECRLSLQGSY
jgi:pSer/pThr/pTyr-binding forkhead associated (FHA) protein